MATTFERDRARFLGRGFRLRQGFAAGAAADTDITITGIKPGDHIVSAFHLAAPAATSGGIVLADLTAECIITAADTIQFTTTATSGTGEQVLITWLTTKL